MSDSRFENFLKRMEAFGFKMDSRIEQRNANGLLGMYAAEPIKKGTLLVKFPISMMIPRSDSIDFSGSPNEEVHSLVHALATQLASKESIYECYFEYCGTLEERQKRSVCFFSAEEFGILEQMNPLLAQLAHTSKTHWEHLVQTVSTKDPSLDRHSIMLASLIYRERCWGKGLGFLPGIDLFNHNTKSNISPQRAIVDGEKCIIIVADRDINSGDEIKTTYGPKDMFKFAFNYDFFDPNDYHIVSYSSRITQAITDGFTQKVVENLKNHYDLNVFEIDGVARFLINESSAFFLEKGPNAAMVELASRIAINNEAELRQGKAEEKTTARYLLYILQSFRKANNVENIDKETLPEKLHTFHDVLTAELDTLCANIQAIEPRCV
jgi:SET domain